VLASLSLGAISKAKKATDAAICRNNLRQQTVALSVYASDFSCYPAYYYDIGAEPRSWSQCLKGYVGGMEWPARNWSFTGSLKTSNPVKSVYTCPAYQRVRGVYDASIPKHDSEGMIHAWSGAYGYNGGTSPVFDAAFVGQQSGLLLLDGGVGGTNATSAAREGEISSPSRLIASGDAQMWRILAGNNTSEEEIVGGFSSAPHFLQMTGLVERDRGFKLSLLSNEKAMLQRHSGKWQMGFCDGHVESGKVLAFFNYHSDEVIKLWRRDNQVRRATAVGP